MDKRAQQALRQTRNSDIQYRIGLVLYRYSRYSKYIHSNKQSTTKFTRELIPSIIKFIDELCGKAVHRRRVGRWYLCETLGKGGYSWVKKGIDEKTGKQVALKFISRKHASWTETQINQIHTEISILRNIRHPNIMKLLAYNLKCQYPNESGTGSDEVILLVLEYMNGGELFDYLYYTGRFNEIVARTYFNQLCHAVITCHEYGIIHRDIKPQNLLLNYRFQLKLTDFGLSKMLKQESVDKTMKTHVGTAGYQAPEIVEGKRYTKQVDTFSIGVVLFIFIAGHPPFNNATKNDKWYSHIYKGDYNSFWKTHTKTKKYFTKNKILLDLVTRMLLKNPDKRINLKDVYRHKWMKKQPVLDSTNLQKYFKLRFREMRRLRQNDPIKQEMLKGDCYYDPSKKLTNRGVFEENKLMPLGYKLDTKPHTLYENIIKDKIVNDVSIITSDIIPKKGSNDNNDDSKDNSNNNDNTSDNISFDDITFEDVGDGDGDVFTLGVYDIYLKDKYNNLAWDVLECIEHTIVEVFSGRIISNNYQMFELIVEITIETNGLSQSIPITISFRLFNSQEKKCLFLQIKNITNVDETKLTHELINQSFHLIMKNKYLASYLFVSLKDVNKTDKTLTDEEQAFLKSIDGDDTSAISTTTIDSPTDDDVFNDFTDE